MGMLPCVAHDTRREALFGAIVGAIGGLILGGMVGALFVGDGFDEWTYTGGLLGAIGGVILGGISGIITSRRRRGSGGT